MQKIQKNLIYIILNILFISFSFEVSSFETITKILATVNGVPITSDDLDYRMNLILYNANLDKNSKNKQKFYSDVLDRLIEDELKLQEGMKLDESLVKRAKIKAKELIKQNFGKNQFELEKSLKNMGVSFEHIQSLFIAEIIWNSLVRARHRNEFNNIDVEITNRLKSQKNKLSQPHIKVSEIILVPNNSRNIEKTLILADKIYESILEGANFASLAKQFSSSKSRISGGLLGWIKLKDIPEETYKIIKPLEIGDINKPQMINGVFKIFRLEGKLINGIQDPKETIFSLVSLFIPSNKSNTKADDTNLKKKIQNDLKNVSSCMDLNQVSLEYNNDPLDIIKIPFFEIDKDLKKEIIFLQKNEYTQPLFVKNGLIVIMVCDKFLPKIKLTDKKSLKTRIENELVVQLSDRYLNRIKRIAFIYKNK